MILQNDKKGAGVKFPPPLIYLISLFTAYGVHLLWPVGFGIKPGLHYLGLLITTLGLAIVLLATLIFKRVETSIEPWKPTTKIISSGIYAYSRNPIYVAFFLIQMGVAVFLNSFWILISFIPAVVLVYYIVIQKEESYLAEKFGEEYISYKNRVRRWL